MDITIISAVPTFGPTGNYIALILKNPGNAHKKFADYVKHTSIFCTGPSGSHSRRLRFFGHLMCDWPEEESHQEIFDINLVDAGGKTLGNVIANRKPGLVKQYHTVACIREFSIFESDDPEGSFSAPYKQLVEWLEFSLLHGIDHFFVYTFEGTDRAVLDLLMPYFESGQASRIHFQSFPQLQYDRHTYVHEDCLYRAKNHAAWLLPTVDVDEYIRMGSGDLFQGAVPQNYLNSMWDIFAERRNVSRNKVHSISFWRYRFARSKRDEPEIVSSWREPVRQREINKGTAGLGMQAQPKYVVNVDRAFALMSHSVSVFDKGTVKLELPETMAFANHYRLDYQIKYGNESKDPKATTFDNFLAADVPKIEKALRERFGENPKNLLKRLSQRCPPSSRSIV
eukprot:s619_g27.t1